MTYPHRLHPLALALLLVAPTACAPPSGEAPAERAEVDAAQPLAGSSLVGSWRAVLASPGGPLPFTLRIEADGSAVMDNGEEETPVGAIETRGAEVVLHFDWYDSEITAELDGDAARLEGRWRKTVPEGDSVLPFSAVKADPRRFLSIAEAGLDPAPGAAEQPSIDGVWSVVFTEVLDDPAAQAEVEPEQAQGEFIQG